VTYPTAPEPPPPAAAEPVAPPATLYSPDGRWYWDGARWQALASPPPAWARPYAEPDSRATAAGTLIGVAVGGAGLYVVALGVLLVIRLVDFQGSALDQANGLFASVATFVFLAGLVGGAIAVPLWLHRCFGNLPALGTAPRTWSPAWAAWGWFIPGANLVIPCLIAGALWRSVHAEARTAFPFVGLWWAAWVAGQLTLLLVLLLPPSFVTYVVGILATALIAASGALLILIIRRVTRRQMERYAQLHAG
jgi:hypothetical protein